MTEEMLEERVRYFSSLGGSDEAAGIRAEMQSEALFSDMEAFKVGQVCTFLSAYYFVGPKWI